MYQVPNNPEIAALTMEIYEQHQGIISSVCHGTAGIVHLTLKNGDYLVANKTITAIQKSLKSKTPDYFKQFPFLMRKTVRVS